MLNKDALAKYQEPAHLDNEKKADRSQGQFSSFLPGISNFLEIFLKETTTRRKGKMDAKQDLLDINMGIIPFAQN